jgi:FtsH-binding integral membrane protein
MDAKNVLLVDSAFEGGLSLLLLVGVGAGWLSGADFARPATTGVLVGVAVCLAALALILALLARRPSPGRGAVLALALVNDATACVALLWLLAATGFSAVGVALVTVTVLGLFALSTLQLRQVIRGRRTTARPGH